MQSKRIIGLSEPAVPITLDPLPEALSVLGLVLQNSPGEDRPARPGSPSAITVIPLRQPRLTSASPTWLVRGRVPLPLLFQQSCLEQDCPPELSGCWQCSLWVLCDAVASTHVWPWALVA